MANAEIPGSATEITAEWIADALERGGIAPGSTVRSFECEPVVEGTSFTSDVQRLRIEYEPAGPAGPETLIAKLPSRNEQNRAVASLFRLYEREVFFYNDLAGRSPLRTPPCHFSAVEAGGGDFALLLEDQAPMVIGDQLAGCSVDQAEAAVRELARFHAFWWAQPALAAIDWMPSWNDPVFAPIVRGAFEQAWAPFVQIFRSILPERVVRMGDSFPDRMAPILDRLSTPPRTICHGDLRADNIFFRGERGCTTLTVIDWQLSCRGRGTFDIAYLMSQSTPSALRRTSEMDILKTYHDTLRKHGVGDYDFESCWADYRLSALYCLVYPVIVVGGLDLENQRQMETMSVVAERAATMIVDLDLDRLDVR